MREGGQLVFAVEQVPYWAMLVVEADCPTPAAQYEKAAEIKSAWPVAAEDLQLVPKAEAGGGKPSWRDMVSPVNWGGGETTAERVKDPDAVNGGAVRGKPDRPPGGMACTYSYPRIPGKYLRHVPPEGGRQHDWQAGLPYRRRRLRYAPAARRAGDLEPDAGNQSDGLQEAQRLPGPHRHIRALGHGFRHSTNSRIRSFPASSWTGGRCSRRTWWCWRTSKLAGWALGRCG